jgi:peptide/nickel transport system permease protein
MIVVLFAVSVLTFLIFNVIPGGDPAVRMAGKQPDPGQLKIIRHQWGFDEPVYVQYEKTMEKIVTGDLISYSTQQDVMDEIWSRVPRTFALAIGAAILWMVFAIALGVFTAIRAGQFSDRFLTVLALIGISMPVFWIGALMNYYIGFKWGILPNGGYVEFTDDPWEWFKHLLMPWSASTRESCARTCSTR